MVICLIASAYLGYLTPFAIKDLFASLKSDDDFFNSAFQLGKIFIGEYLIRCCFQAGTGLYVRNLLQNVRTKCYRVWIKNYDTLLEGQDRSVKKFSMGEVLSRIMNDTEAVRELISTGSIGIFIDVFFILSYLLAFLKLNTTSGIFLLFAELLACGLLFWGGKWMARVFMAVRKSIADMAKDLSDLAGGFFQMYFLPDYQFASKKGAVVFEEFLRKQLKANVFDAAFYAVAESLYPILIVGLMFVFPYSQITEVAVLAAILDLIQRSIGPIKDVAGKISNIQRAKTGLVRIQEFEHGLSQGPKSELTFSRKTSRHRFEKFEIQLPAFTYPQSQSKFQISEISLSLKPGNVIGVVGQSGSGKSTLLKILAGEILTTHGELRVEAKAPAETVEIQGEDFKQLQLYRSLISMVAQDAHIFSDTLKFNITLGQKGTQDFKSFWQKMERELPVLSKFELSPEGTIDPDLLSSGQKQLISTLRACFLERPILLFDEISSSLDADLETALRKMILANREHSLIIIVAHRVETIVEADEILVMKEGKIIERGRHQHLKKTSSTYQAFLKEISRPSSDKNPVE